MHNENAERMLLSAFSTGLVGAAGRQVRYSNPGTLEQALQIAPTVREAKRQKNLVSVFMRISIGLLDLLQSLRAAHTRKTKSRDVQMTRARSTARDVSGMELLLVPVIQ
jgi:hypothetical protein